MIAPHPGHMTQTCVQPNYNFKFVSVQISVHTDDSPHRAPGGKGAPSVSPWVPLSLSKSKNQIALTQCETPRKSSPFSPLPKFIWRPVRLPHAENRNSEWPVSSIGPSKRPGNNRVVTKNAMVFVAPTLSEISTQTGESRASPERHLRFSLRNGEF